jgi:cytochrome c oxidase assembly protein Cox11
MQTIIIVVLLLFFGLSFSVVLLIYSVKCRPSSLDGQTKTLRCRQSVKKCRCFKRLPRSYSEYIRDHNYNGGREVVVVEGGRNENG